MTPSAIRSAASTRAIASIAARIATSRVGILEQRAHESRNGRDLGVRHDDGTATPLEVACVQRLVVGCGMGVRHQDRRRTSGGELPHGPARPRDSNVGGGEDIAEVVGLRHQQVVGPVDTRRKRGVIALARDVQHGRAVVAPGADRHLVERRRSGKCTEDGDDRRIGADPEAGAGISAARPEMGVRDRPADDLDLVPGAPLDLVGEEQLRGERCGEPIGEAEMCVGLGQGRRDPAQSRRQHHRAGDIPAASEDDIGTATTQDGAAGERCLRRPHERAHELQRRLPREAADLERVELEARLRNQTRLDAVGTPGERHGRSARAQCLPDCESGPDVTGCSPCRYHDYELRRLDHSRRC